MTLMNISTGASAAANAASLQAQISASTGAGATLEWPDGHFFLDPITPAPNVPLVGKSPYATTLLPSQPNITMIGYLASGSIQKNFEVSKVGFNANGFTGVTPIKIDGNTSAIRTSKLRLLDLDFEGAFAQAISLRYTANVWIDKIWASGCVNGILTDNCADTDMASIKVQNGAGVGYKFIGNNDPFCEGMRLTDLSTNGQNQGMIVDGPSWGVAKGLSLTTCAGGALQILNATNNWGFDNSEFSVAGTSPSQANVVTSAQSSDISFTGGSKFILGTFGAILRGTRNSISGACKFKANSNVDVYLDQAFDCEVLGNICDSTAVPWSIYEYTTSNRNKIDSNLTKGLVVKTGANSTADNNANY